MSPRTGRVVSKAQPGCVGRLFSVVLGIKTFKSTLLKLGSVGSDVLFLLQCVCVCVSVCTCIRVMDKKTDLKVRDFKEPLSPNGKHETVLKYSPLRKATSLREKEPATEGPSHGDVIRKKQIRKQQRALGVSSLGDFKSFIQMNSVSLQEA